MASHIGQAFGIADIGIEGYYGDPLLEKRIDLWADLLLIKGSQGKTVYAIQKKLINGGQLCFHRRGNLLDQDAAAISGELFGLFLDTI